MERIEAELLIPGAGEPVGDGVVIIDNSVISYAGPASQAPATPGAVVHRTETVMPGLWDCHGHFLGLKGLDISQLPLDPVPLRAARCTRDLGAALRAGITSVREVGGLGVYLARAVSEGVLDGPAIYAAGAILSITGGHADLHSYPLPWIGDFGAHHGELRAIVEVAGLAERIVAAHCHGKPGIMAAVEAGVGTIEHGTYLDDEACDALRETGTILVATRTIFEGILANLAAVPEYAAAKLTAVAGRHAEAVSRAIERGVTIAMGTDISVTGPDRPNCWGTNGAELGHLARLGMTPLQAIEAATATAPLTLGPQAPRSGRLEPGYDADIITVAGNPLADIAVLGRPERITGVWRNGRSVTSQTPL